MHTIDQTTDTRKHSRLNSATSNGQHRRSHPKFHGTILDKLEVYQRLAREWRRHLTKAECLLMFYVIDRTVGMGVLAFDATYQQMVEGNALFPPVGIGVRQLKALVESLSKKGPITARNVSNLCMIIGVNLDWSACRKLHDQRPGESEKLHDRRAKNCTPLDKYSGQIPFSAGADRHSDQAPARNSPPSQTPTPGASFAEVGLGGPTSARAEAETDLPEQGSKQAARHEASASSAAEQEPAAPRPDPRRDDPWTIGEWVRDQREKHGIAEEDFAATLGIAIFQLRLIESGAEALDSHRCRAWLCRYFDGLEHPSFASGCATPFHELYQREAAKWKFEGQRRLPAMAEAEL